MSADRLWAKSWRASAPAPEHVFLLQHLRDVHAAAERVLDSTGDEQLCALGLKSSEYRDRFRRIVLLAAALHDWGKANDHFQEMILTRRDVRYNPQGLRHEWVTILIVRDFRGWLLPAVEGHDIDYAIAEWAIAGHHPALDHPSPPRFCPPGAGSEVHLLIDHREFAEVASWLGKTFGLGTLTLPCNPRRGLVGPANVFDELGRWHRNSQQMFDRVRSSQDRLLVAAAKSCLIAADVAGSALPKAFAGDDGLWGWIPQSFAAKPRVGDLQAVVGRRLDASKRGHVDPDDVDARKQFQDAVASSEGPVTYVKAGCGTGKTLAAYMWAAKNHPTRRLYFCYPTTGTATEGFKDYLFEPEGELGDIGARLFHSRRDVDFEMILSTGRDTERREPEEFARLQSLEAWSTPIVVCTVDTVLGIVQNNKRGLFAWPALAQSAFVFDEIHAYDDRLFGALLRFLRDLPQLPVLLMTASLPKAREESLQRLLVKMGRPLNPVLGPVALEGRPRYHRATVANSDPLPLVQKTLHQDGKVLWVCNTVNRVMEAAQHAEVKGLNPLIYHSRFKYADRVERHKAVVSAFNPEHTESVLAITSQVCELSLDLKGCSLLVSELAPVPAMIQRLGRLNRQANKGDPTKPFVILEPDNHLPYTPADFESARRWLAKLSENAISQTHLAELWEQEGDHPPDLVPSAWIDGGPTTTVSELREASPGITVIMNEPGHLDLDAVLTYEARIKHVKKKASTEKRNPTEVELRPQEGEARLSAVIVPMPPPPQKYNWRSWKQHKGIPIAEPGAIIYDNLRGAQWKS